MYRQELSTETYLQQARENEALQQAALQAEQTMGKVTGPSWSKVPGPSWAKGLTIICLFFLLIGLTGSASAVLELHQLNGTTLSQRARSSRSRSREDRQVAKIKQMRKQATEEHFLLLLSASLVKLSIGIAFLGCAVLLILRQRNARLLAVGLCGTAMFYHVCTMGVSFLMASETKGAVFEMMDSAWNEAARGSSLSKHEKKQARDAAGNVFAFGMTAGVAIVFLARLLFYGSLLAYLLQSDIKPIFGEDPLDYVKQQAWDTDPGLT